MTRRPVECLAAPKDAREAYLVEIGRAAFRTPLILGGQAARAGLTCEACHQNGRTNPNFDFPGLSGASGTADVTSFLFSTHRGDHVDNPKPIPDLGGPKVRLRVPQARGGRALEDFINGLVTQEFTGAAPPPAVLDGLAAYVRALSPTACRKAVSEPVRLGSAIADARRAVSSARLALEQGDRLAAAVMVQAARSQLGAIAERYEGPGLATARRSLGLADIDLGAALAAIRRGDGGEAQRLTLWLSRSQAWAAVLRLDEARSLYAPTVLARRLSAPPISATRE